MSEWLYYEGKAGHGMIRISEIAVVRQYSGDTSETFVNLKGDSEGSEPYRIVRPTFGQILKLLDPETPHG